MGIFGGKPSYHVLPVADYIEHEKAADCICGPRVEDQPTGRIYQHHSLDGREFREKKDNGGPADPGSA